MLRRIPSETQSLNLDPRLKKLLITYEEVFGALPPPLSCKKLVQMDLKLKPEFEKTRVRRRPYPAPQEQVEPLGHWNWKWNQARSNYSTYDQELLAGMLVLSSQSRPLGSNPIVSLCDQEPVKSFQKGPPPEKAKLKRLPDLPEPVQADSASYPRD